MLYNLKKEKSTLNWNITFFCLMKCPLYFLFDTFLYTYFLSCLWKNVTYIIPWNCYCYIKNNGADILLILACFRRDVLLKASTQINKTDLLITLDLVDDERLLLPTRVKLAWFMYFAYILLYFRIRKAPGKYIFSHSMGLWEKRFSTFKDGCDCWSILYFT